MFYNAKLIKPPLTRFLKYFIAIPPPYIFYSTSYSKLLLSTLPGYSTVYSLNLLLNFFFVISQLPTQYVVRQYVPVIT
jgi:hypothetical protein